MYVEPRKIVQMNQVAGQKLRHRCREEMYGQQGGESRGGVGMVMCWTGYWHVYSDVYRIDDWLKKNLQTINAGEGVEKKEPSCIVGGDVNWYIHYGEQYGGSS